MPQTTTETPLLECRGIGKQFGGQTVLADIDLSIRAGEIHGLVGSNGAGKSTLMKILAGAVPDHEGLILLDGQRIELASPQAALAHGIAMVYQELSGIGQLSVAENLFLGRQPTTRLGTIDWAGMRRQAREQLAELQLQIDVGRRLDSYPLVVRQMVEIARGLHSGARLLILDEPTSALSPPETRRLFEFLRGLRERGVAIVFISHFIEDVLEICDRLSILKDGRLLSTGPASQWQKHDVIQAMLGHTLATSLAEAGQIRLPPPTSSLPILEARGISLTGAFSDIDLSVSPGECLGLYGFVGAGHQELAHALAGTLTVSQGQMLLEGRPLPAGKTRQAIRRGLVLVAADRAQTLVHQSEIYKNVTLAHLRSAVGNWLSSPREVSVTRPLLERVGCRPRAPRLPAGRLSGGNQQKVVLAKWLLGPVRVLVLDEPTRGMDVGAKQEIMALVRDLKSRGTAVILSSSEPEMLLEHADRILVLSRGRISHEFSDVALDKPTLMRQA